MNDPSGYVLKAACSHCGQYGWIDDGSLICRRCGQTHEITEAEARQRAADMALWSAAMASRKRWWQR